MIALVEAAIRRTWRSYWLPTGTHPTMAGSKIGIGKVRQTVTSAVQDLARRRNPRCRLAASMSEPQIETANGSGAPRFSQSVRFDARPGRSRVELLAEVAFGYRPDHGGSDSPVDVREALSAYIDVAEWEQVVDRIAIRGRESSQGEVLRLSSIVSAQRESLRQRRLSCEVEALGVDPDLLGQWIYGAVADAYAKDPEIYEDGYRRTEHLEAAARKRIIAKGYEVIAGHLRVVKPSYPRRLQRWRQWRRTDDGPRPRQSSLPIQGGGQDSGQGRGEASAPLGRGAPIPRAPDPASRFAPRDPRHRPARRGP
jgi:hypothetical protein